MKPSDFYTVPASEAGIRVPLLLADGTDSGEWLRVHGPDSRAYVKAQQALLRRIAELGAIEDEEAHEAAAQDILAETRAALLVAWSFDEPLTAESARDFLRNAPRIARQIDAVAGDASRFFGPGSPDSTNGQASSAPSVVAAGTPSPSDSGSAKRARRNSPTSSRTGENLSPAA